MLLRRLEESIIANDQLLNDVQGRLFQLVDQAAEVIELIPLSPAVLRAAVGELLIHDPTDNLILHSIIEHARRHGDSKKAFLTDNSADFDTSTVRAALAAVGMNKPFKTAQNVLGWLSSLD